MLSSNPVSTPFADCQKAGDMTKLKEENEFREIVGSLQYLATQTRPDIAFTVNWLGRRVCEPTVLDLQVAKRCLRYLNGTRNLGITYTRWNNDLRFSLEAYTDADFAGDAKTYKSTTGMVILLGGAPIVWKSKLQRSVVTSTTEAETLALSSTVKTVTFLRHFAESIKALPPQKVPVKCDNSGTVLLVKGEASTQRTRHIGAQLYYSRQQHQNGIVNVQHVPGQQQLADILTKPISGDKFTKNVAWLLVPIMLISLVGLVTNEEMIGRMKPTIWLPTNHRIQIGHQTLSVTITINDHCRGLRRIHGSQINPTLRGMIRKGIDRCEAWRSQLIAPKLKTLASLQVKTRRQPRSTPDVYLPETEQIGMSDAHYYSTFIIPGYESIWERYHNKSGYNTIKSHNDVIKILLNMVNTHGNIIQTQINQNEKSISAINTLTSILNDTTTLQTLTNELIPLLAGELARCESAIRADTDILTEAIAQINKGRLTWSTFQKLTGPGQAELTETLKPWHNDESIVTKTAVIDNFVYLELEGPTISEDTTIYKSVHFLDWLGEGQYRKCHGEQFIVYNSSSNCTRQIGVPLTKLVNLQCIKTNFTEYPAPQCETILSETNIIQPEVIQTDSCLLVQCRGNNLTLNGQTGPCPSYPFALLLNVSMQIDGHLHFYQHDSIRIEQNETSTPIMLQKITNPWQDSLVEIFNTTSLMAKDNDKMNSTLTKKPRFDLNNLAEPEWWGSISSTTLLVIGFIIYMIFRNQKSNIQQLVETSMMLSMTDKFLSKSLPVLPTSSTITTTTGPSTAAVSRIYPNPWEILTPSAPLPCSHHVRIDVPEVSEAIERALSSRKKGWMHNRPSTPFPSIEASIESLTTGKSCDWSTTSTDFEKEFDSELIRPEPKPTRFLPKIFLSTLSLPNAST